MSEDEEVKILLVEDDEGHADLMRMNLKRGGLANEVLHFSGGRRVMEFLEQRQGRMSGDKYMMILDINMPGMDGHRVLERIKGNENTRMIPVIMLTTAEDEREVARCYRLGCNLYLTKPVSYEEFSAAIHQLGLFIRQAKFPGLSVLRAA